jgi:hypothetical protein
MISPDGIKLNLDKVAAVANWPAPQDVQDLMGFLGLTNYFRRLICDYARIAQPLTDLTRDIPIDIPKFAGKARKGAYKCALKARALYTEPRVRLESSGVHLHSRRTPSGVQAESRRSPSGVQEESKRSPEGVQEDLPGVQKESRRSPGGVQEDLPGVHKESARS